MSEWQKADLHIHSALSSCADDEMTPHNIVNMAKLLGLKVIAITDHQAADNVPAVIQVAREQGIICLPGIEVQTKEEAHLLAYFPHVASLLCFAEKIQVEMGSKRAASAHFGRQLVLDRDDRVVGEHPALLHQSTMLTVEQVFYLTTELGGCLVPAHLDRPLFSIQSQLGFLPTTLPIATVEYSQAYFARCGVMCFSGRLLAITSSDAHSLSQMVTLGNSWLHASLFDAQSICEALRCGDRQKVQAYCPNSLT